MLSFFLWMVTNLENTSSETENDQQSEKWGRLSIALHILLPMAGLVLLLKQKDIFSRLLLQLDRNCVAVFCPSFSRREKLLKWAGSRLPATWSSQSKTLSGGIAELWTDGSLLCTLINSAIPGACPNPHRHWKKPPLHAQAVAYKYLGVIPIFTESDLTGNFSRQERNFLHYLNELQQAITKLSDRNEVFRCISTQYIARGMGLYTGEQHRKTMFYVYPNMVSPAYRSSNVIIHIRGPYGTYGKAVIPKFHELFATPEINVISDKELLKKLVKKDDRPKNSFIKSFSMPFIQYHKKHMGDNIVIDVAMEENRAQVTYIPKNYGMYEIIMISNGELVRGCPFSVHILNNTSGIEENFEADENKDDIPGIKKRKVISKTIDFVDEQISITEVLKKYRCNEQSSNQQNRPKSAPVTSKGFSFSDVVEEVLKIGVKDIHHVESISQDPSGDVDKTDNNRTFLSKNCSNISEEEKQNSESVNEIYKDTKYEEKLDQIQEKVIPLDIKTCKQNEEGDSATREVVNYVLLDNNFKANKVNHCALIDTDKRPMFVRSKHECNTDNKDNKFTLVDYPRKFHVNKIQIPEKFCQLQDMCSRNFVSGLDRKYFKNVINSSNKRDLPMFLTQSSIKQDGQKNTEEIVSSQNEDINNNTDNLEGSEVKQNLVNALSRRNSKADIEKIKAVPKRFFQVPKENSKPSLVDQNITSPICSDHIVPEVDSVFSKMSVAEKRKIFAKQIPRKSSNSSNSSSSETEKSESLKDHRHFEGLSVLNYLGSLKDSDGSKSSINYSLSSTMSLPNISTVESEYIFQNSVRARKNFWEKVSSSNTSLSNISDGAPKTKSKILTESERCRLIWKKPESVEEKCDLEKKSEMYKSVDDILHNKNSLKRHNSKKYKSLDNSLDNCVVLSIDERKKILLKQNYKKEKINREKENSPKNNSFKNNYGVNMNGKKENNCSIVVSPLSDKIRKYDNACNLSNSTEEKTSTNNNNDSKNATNDLCKNYIHNDLQNLSQPQKLNVRSHFKRVFKYFKNLEEKSLGKTKPHSTKKACRRHSLDFQLNKNKPSRKGGSLNLPNVSDRFSISNLYEDVFGSKRGSFRGAANRSAVVEALATFARRENSSFNEDDEDNIKYNMFKKKAKTRIRRNIRSIFDVYY